MKKFIKTHTATVVKINLLLIFLTLLLIKFEIIGSYSIFAYVTSYFIIPITLLIYLVRIFILKNQKQFVDIGKNVISLIQFSVISFLLFFILVKVELVNPVLGYVYVYIIFPYTLLIYLISAIILFKSKKPKILKKISLVFLFWLLILVSGIILNIILK